MTIDMDKEKGRAPRIDKKTGQSKPNQIMVRIKGTGEINMAVIDGYLEKKMPFDNSILEAISELANRWNLTSSILILYRLSRPLYAPVSRRALCTI